MPTDQNPADLLTRGLSLNKFKDLLQFWTYGPEWLKTADSDWPVNELNCLGDDNKIRSANAKRDGSIQNYSINHLYPLELQQLTNESISPCNNVDETPPVGHLPVETVRRSARLMAQRAKSQ